ncbi:bifunctional oligoribonuclease/PAP phosphatase NrnA [Candidatus Berkelbacteria bacterium]|nr:bifunctional oligoribonuclease/PAP phosphatase NrnA [Candidatus Berkelbacteria bacterium]
MNGALAQTVDLIKILDRILILVHREPDGDTLASSLALAASIGQLGKSVVVAGRDPVPGVFQFLPGAYTITNDFLLSDYELVLVIDCGDLRRTGFPERLIQFAKTKGRLLNIDHHGKSDLHKVANINFWDPTACAAGQLVVELIDGIGADITGDIATCLLTAIYTDTGGFRHANTTPATLRLAARLLNEGARLREITEHLLNSKSIASLRLLGLVLSRIKRFRKLGLVSSFVTHHDLERLGGSPIDLAGAVNVIGQTPGAKASILFTEVDDGKLKASIRTETDGVDVSQFAEIFGGGGHRRASGFVIDGKIIRKGRKFEIDLDEKT